MILSRNHRIRNMSKKEPSVALDETSKNSTQGYSIRLDRKLIHQLEVVAEKRHLVNTSALIRQYISEGLERDLERYRWSALQELVDTLRDQGVDEETLKEAFNKVVSSMPPLP